MHYYANPDPILRALAERLFGYKGTKFQIITGNAFSPHAYWDGGTRSTYRMIRREGMQVSVPNGAIENPFNQVAHKDIEIPPGHFVVEHHIFCGKDMGIIFRVREDELDTRMLPASQELTAPEKLVLSVHAGLKSFARKEYIARLGLTSRHEEIKASLVEKKLMLKNGAVTPEGRNNRVDFDTHAYNGLRWEGDIPLDKEGNPVELKTRNW